MTPNLPPIAITGIGSVSPYGPLAGLIPQYPLEPSAITAWKTDGLRRAFVVPPFRPASVVPGLKTRRLDRLSAWALVASSLAIKDAGIDLSQVDRSRVAVVFATAFGCVELTEAFYLSAAANGWNGTDPSTFPETLPSAPASHVSMFHGLRGPNVTVSNKHFAGENALILAASLLRHGQADLAIVLAGDALMQSVYSWYEVAGLLSAACYNSDPLPEAGGFIPSEGVAALVMQPSGDFQSDVRPGTRSYARIRSGRWAAGGQREQIIQQTLGGSVPGLTVCSGNGAPCATTPTTALAREISGDSTVIIHPQAFAQGLAGTGALFHLILWLRSLSGSLPSDRPISRQALLLATASDSGFAAIHLELPLNMNVRIAAAAYAVPPHDEAVEAVLERERARVEKSLSPLSPESRRKALEGLGLNRLRICGEKQLYELVREAASKAIAEAGITARDINLILDFSTWSSESSSSENPLGLSFAHKLSADLGAESAMILSFKVGGCAGLHVAIKTALGWMATDESIQTVLLITGDAAPEGNRSLLPITMHGDAASAVILRRECTDGPLLLGVEAMTLGHLQNAITMVRTNGHLDIVVDALCMERDVMPVYFLNMLLTVNKALEAASLTLSNIDHFIYSNISRRDREGFCKMLGRPKGSLPPTAMEEYGHTFGSDLVINYVNMRREGLIRPGQLLLFASAGIGFTWGVTIARA